MLFQISHTIEELSSGTEYVVFVHLVKLFEGKAFPSAKVSKVFTTNAPPGKSETDKLRNESAA